MSVFKHRILLTIFLFLAAGLVFGLYRNTTKAPVSLPLMPKIAEEPEIDWKSYVNRDFGYSVRYPSDWEIAEWDINTASNISRPPDGSIWQQATFSGENGRFEVIVWENASYVPVRTWVSWFLHEAITIANLPLEPNSTLAGLEAVSYVQHVTGRDKPLHYIFAGKEGRVYELVFDRDDVTGSSATANTLPDHAIYDSVVESFIFLVDPAPQS